MRNIEREDILELACRADRAGQKNLASNLYVVAELMSDSGDGNSRTIAGVCMGEVDDAIGRVVSRIEEIIEAGSDRGSRLGIGFAAGMVS